ARRGTADLDDGDKGRAADRCNRKTLMISSDLVLACAMASLTVVPESMARSAILIVMLLLGVFSNLFEVSLNAATPSILNTQDTLKANSWLMGGRNIMVALSGLCAAGACYVFEGYDAIFLIDAATYVFSALVLSRLTIRTEGRAKKPATEKPSFAQLLKEDFKAVRTLPNAATMTLFLSILFLDAFASASHNIGWPVFSRQLNPANPMFYYGVILSFWALGNVAGIYVLNRLPALKTAKPEKVYLAFTALMSVGMIMIFQTAWPAVITAAAFTAGAGDGTYQTYFTTYLQQTPDALRGRIFALCGITLQTGFGIGFIAAPFALNYLPVGITVLAFHGLVLAAAAVSFTLIAAPKSANAAAKPC
ncbi:MAG TPA: MFS transporter, partial [Elusimicrobiales bacterium]|nr:MFS transporter [Elusimicrobiales bacterium]